MIGGSFADPARLVEGGAKKEGPDGSIILYIIIF